MAITASTDLASAATTAYEKTAYLQLRAKELYSTSMISTVKPTNLSHAGDVVTFWFDDDLPDATAELTEATDVTPQTMGDSSVTVTLAERGAAVGRTRKAKGTDMLTLDMRVAIANGRNMANSYEALCRTALLAGTNVYYGGDAVSTVTVDTGDLLTSALVREVVGRMRQDDVAPVIGDKYLATVTPYQSIDLREETGDAAWLPVHTGTDSLSGGIVEGMIGSHGGAVFVESSRVAVEADGGVGTTDVAKAIFLGSEALACAYSQTASGPVPGVEISPGTDLLNRFNHIGWYWLGGHAVFRQEAVRRIETTTRIT